jgi:hypothetical protein
VSEAALFQVLSTEGFLSVDLYRQVEAAGVSCKAPPSTFADICLTPHSISPSLSASATACVRFRASKNSSRVLT